MALQELIKRNGSKESFNRNKIIKAIHKATDRSKETVDFDSFFLYFNTCFNYTSVPISLVQDAVEISLIECGYAKTAKEYILYREKKDSLRDPYNKLKEEFTDTHTEYILETIWKHYIPDFTPIVNRYFSYKKGDSPDEKTLLKAMVESITIDNTEWDYIAGYYYYRLIDIEYNNNIKVLGHLSPQDMFLDSLKNEYYHKDLEGYDYQFTLYEMFNFLENKTSIPVKHFTYSGVDLLYKRYLLRDKKGWIRENIQTMFLRVAMYLSLANKQEDRVNKVYEYYNQLINFDLTLATPTLGNAGTSTPQLSSCFIDTVHDSLDGIYRSLFEFARISKLGGGMGIYLGKVRATGSAIRGVPNASGGVIKWIRLFNDTAVAVDQLSRRSGACTITLDIWHKDIPEFLQLRTNNGDDRMKAHDIFPAVSIPNLFWKYAKEYIDATWYMFCPYEVKEYMGYSLEDYYGEEWEKKYQECIRNKELPRREISVKDMVRLIIKSAVETGTPFIFNRDIVNKYNPMKDKGMIYSSNLCVSGDTKILTDKGYKEIQTLQDKKVILWNGKEWSLGVVRKTGVSNEMLNIKFKNRNTEITCTLYHKFYIKEGNEIVVKEAKDLKLGDTTITYNLPTEENVKAIVSEITPLQKTFDTYCAYEPKENKIILNGILTGNCMEIAQNMSSYKLLYKGEDIYQSDILTEVYSESNFVTCNLASINLAKHINLDKKTIDYAKLKHTIYNTVEMLDNVISLNQLPTMFAKKMNDEYRSIGLGTSGYHHMLALLGIKWESEEHIRLADELYEFINRSALEKSALLAMTRGKCKAFEGSTYNTGEYFTLRNYYGEEWEKVKKLIKIAGLRNAYILAIAPTGSTSVIANTSAGIDPIQKKFFLEEKKGSIVPRTAPDLNNDTFWFYKEAHNIDHKWTIKAGGARQRHIDQSQSLNLFITHDYSFKDILNLYLLAWENEIKTIYYIRSKSLEVEECVSCSS